MYNYALKGKIHGEACDLTSYVTYLSGGEKNCAYFEAKLADITTQMDGILNGRHGRLYSLIESEIRRTQAQLKALFDTSTTATSEYKTYLAKPSNPACKIAKIRRIQAKAYVAYKPVTCDDYKNSRL